MRRIRIVVVLLALAAGVVAVASSAAARRAPSITMYAVHVSITVPAAPRFGYTTTSLPAGAVVELQRLKTSGWATLQELPRGADKFTTAPQLTTLGRYRYRIQAVQGGAVVASTNVRYIRAYGTVRMSALCGPMENLCRNQHKPVTIGGEAFYYAMDIGAAMYPNYSTSNAAHLAATSCRSITMQFASEDWADDAAYLEVTQPGVAAQKANVPANTVGHLGATLTGGPFVIAASLKPHKANGMLVGGYASCFTANGVPPT